LSNIVAIPTSIATEKQAKQLNIPLGKQEALLLYAHITLLSLLL
jgi:ribose 5-phosphate isomerase